MIDADFVNAIKDLADAKALERDVDGVPMSNYKLHDIRPRLPEPAVLELHTLGGIVDYLEADVDGLLAGDDEEVHVHIKAHDWVTVAGALRGVHRQRIGYVSSHHKVAPFEFGRWHETEDFVIRLGSMFVAGAGDVAAVIKLAGTVSKEQSVKTEDDGITQTIHVRQGVTFVGSAPLPNPVELAPFRTYNELEQPASKYLLRARGGGEDPVEWALFEADGGAWKLTAIERIAAYLEAELGELAGTVTIIR